MPRIDWQGVHLFSAIENGADAREVAAMRSAATWIVLTGFGWHRLAAGDALVGSARWTTRTWRCGSRGWNESVRR